MELALAALPGVITTCLLIWLLIRVLDKQNEERQAHRIEVDALRSSHGEQVERLLQRIQAPAVAVSTHAAEQFPDPPPQPDLEDDEGLIEMRRREAELQEFGLIP